MLPNVRVCARLNPQSPVVISTEASDNLAKYMFVKHSNQEDVSKRSSAYKATDQEWTFTNVAAGEYLNIELSSFSSISEVGVCTIALNEYSPNLDIRVMDYNDPRDEGSLGSKCILAPELITTLEVAGESAQKKKMTCQLYKCTGTHVQSFLGQYITVRSLEKASDSSLRPIQISDVKAMGTTIDCPYTTFTDGDGNYEIEIAEPTGMTPEKTHVSIASYKADIFDPIDKTLLKAASADTNGGKRELPEAMIIALRVSNTTKMTNLGRNLLSTKVGITSEYFHPTDSNNDGKINKAEFAKFAATRTKFVDAHIVIEVEVWKLLDLDNDNSLDATEFSKAVHGLNSGDIIGMPWLIYSPFETKFLSKFSATTTSAGVEDLAVAFALIPSKSSQLPYSTEQWQTAYESMPNGFSFAAPTISAETNLGNMGTSERPESERYAIPFATKKSNAGTGSVHQLKATVAEIDRVFFSSMVDEVTNELFPKNSWIEIHAIEQLNDVVHWYHESSTEKMQELEEEETEKAGEETTNSEEANPVALASASSASSLGRNLLSNAAASAAEVVRGIEEDSVGIRHRKNAGVPLIDYTSVVVSGMVRFPAEKTQQFVCGLQFAVIKAYKHSKTQDGYNSEPLIFKTDDLGRFDFAVGPGERWAFVASYDGHDICYGGPLLENDSCVHSDSDTRPKLYVDETTKERPKTNNYVELGTDTIGIQGGETMVFVDVTPRRVDIGLYAGQCQNKQYSGYSLLITPANGCGSPISVKDKEIKDVWDKVETSSNVRLWPYAAMDYYIQLEEAPDVSSLNEKTVLENHPGGSCKPPGSNIMQFFRDRNKLVQTLMLHDVTDVSDGTDAQATVRYDYHGWFCALPSLHKTRLASAPTPFSVIEKSETCLNNNGKDTTLTVEHLIGTSENTNYDVDGKKYISIKVWEAHLTDGPSSAIFECTSLNNLVKATVQQSVKDGEDTCHSSKQPCTFTKMDETIDSKTNLPTGYVKFDDAQNTFEVSAADAKSAVPNLVPPYRRDFIARLARDDGWSITSLDIHREFVTLNKKPRGSAGDGGSNKFFSTAPVRGLVYSVVHDPPGGNSFASVAQGTQIDLEVGLSTTRAASYTSGNCFNLGPAIGGEIDGGTSFGSGYLNGELQFKTGDKKRGTGVAGFSLSVSGAREVDGPTVSISAATDNSWDFSMTLSRSMSSSEDPGIPGRYGDVILGGGFEIVYTIQDRVDVNKTTNCLGVFAEIAWEPEKPTSYFISIFSIELQIIPELKKLIADTQIDWTKQQNGSKKQRIEDAIAAWKNTLKWASPIFSDENSFMKSKEVESLSSDNSIFGKLMKPKIEEAYGIYADQRGTKLPGSDEKGVYPVKDDWDQMEKNWKTIPSDKSPVVGVPNIKDGISKPTISEILDVIDYEHMEDGEGSKIDTLSDEKKKQYGSWYPDDSNFIKGYHSSSSSKDKDVFSTTDDGFFSRGMNDLTLKSTPGNLKNDHTPPMDEDLLNSGSTSELITFAGGGTTLEFTSSVSSNIDSNGYSWSIESEAMVKNNFDNEFTIGFVEGGSHFHQGYGKTSSVEHASAWAKHGDIETMYALGDPDPLDKFVIQISTDSRWGTPIFNTIGGASRCPGETRCGGLEYVVKTLTLRA